MASQVEIANMALQMLGESRILRVDDTTESGRTVKTFWTTAVQKMVEDHHWNFAIKRTDQLSAEATVPLYGFDYSYPLPADCLLILDVNDDSDVIYQIETNTTGDKVLLTDEDEVYVRYIYNVTQTGRFSANFTIALATLLAAFMAYKITGSSTDEKRMWEMYTFHKPKAEIVNAREQQPMTTENTSSWITSRS